MANITKRQRKKGTVYTALVRVKGHPAISQSFDRKSEAERWAEDTEAILRDGGYVGEAPPDDMLFDTALTRYLKEVSSQKAAGTNRLETVMSGILAEHFSGYTLQEITPEMAAKFRDHRLQVVKPATVINNLSMFSHIYTVAAREWGVVAVNPASIIRRPKKPAGRLRFLKEPEIVRLLEESKKTKKATLYNYIMLQLHTGMRPSEGAGLTWGQIDLDNRIVDLTKTKTDPRRVPLTVPAIETLAAIMPVKNCSLTDYVFLPKKPKMTHKRRPNQFFRACFEAAVARAGISDFHMHDLRHTAASYMIMNGVDLRTVADILGHKTISMTMRYTHLLDDYKKTAIDKIAGLGV